MTTTTTRTVTMPEYAPVIDLARRLRADCRRFGVDPKDLAEAATIAELRDLKDRALRDLMAAPKSHRAA